MPSSHFHRSAHSPAVFGRRGFSLLEMVIVIVILGSLMIVAIPALREMARQNRLETAANDLAALFRFARSDAVFEEHTTAVYIDMDAGTYQLDLMNDDDETRRRRRNRRTDEGRRMERLRPLPEGIVFKDIYIWEEQVAEDGRAVVEFYPNGTVSPVIIVVAEGEKGPAIHIKLSRSTGRTAIEDGEPKDPILPGQRALIQETVEVED